ncbi:MAG: substrate-binding domain-containing protein [Ignavibacteria bacterium]|nr:substrate-binding domain-containing protein [Ignavibacteria bacterium]
MPVDPTKPLPLYIQVAEDIRSQIEERRLRVGDQIGSHASLSEHYGVSIITIKKALENLVHEGLLFTRVGKGSYVAREHNDGRYSRAITIGLVLRNLQSPFFSLIAQGVEEAAFEAGMNVMLSNSRGRIDREEGQIRHFKKCGVSGMIIASMTHKYHATPLIRRLKNERFPFVMVSYVADDDIPFVGTDHELGGYLAAKHLIGLGYKRIGYIDGERGNLVGALRRKGYEKAFREHRKTIDRSLVFALGHKGEQYDYESGFEIGRSICAKREKPDALFVYNDLSALGCMDALLRHGLRVPDDIAIVGFDDIERGEYATVPLTTIQQPRTEIGKKAVAVLEQMIDGKKTALRTVLRPKLIVRESCGAAKRK